jgi:hypothetical protein
MFGKLRYQRHLREKLAVVVRSLLSAGSEDQNIVIVGSAHKVGSTWLYELVRDLGGYRLPLMRLPKDYFEFGVLKLDNEQVEKKLGQLRGRIILKSHSAPVKFENPNIRLVSIYRDPRDVLVSSAFYLANLDEARGGWGSGFRSLTIEERLIKLIDEGEFIIRKLEQWFYAVDVYKVSYEQLLRDPKPAVTGLVNYLDLKVDDDHILSVIDAHKFENRVGRRKINQQSSKSFLRKGVSGDWKNHFTEKAVKAYKTSMNGRWERILIDMEYEKTTMWGLGG